jgi:hypothetical protein
MQDETGRGKAWPAGRKITVSMARPTVFLCRASSCRECRGYDALREALDDVADVTEVRCQRICDGPVAGAAVNGSLEWFGRLNSDKARRQLVDLVAGSGRLRGSLEKRRERKRSGRMR